MYEVTEVCDRVMFLSRGKILLQGEPEVLIREHGAANLEELVHRGGARGPWRRKAQCMKAQRVAAVVLRLFYLFRGSPVRVLPMFAWVAIDIVLWGFISRYLNKVSGAGLNFVPTLLGAVLLWDFLGRVMQGVTIAFFEDVWSRNFLNMFATPLKISEYLAGLVIVGVVTSLVGLVVMVLLAAGAFGLSFLSYGAAIVPFVLVLFLSGIALGIAGSRACAQAPGPHRRSLIWPIPRCSRPSPASTIRSPPCPAGCRQSPTPSRRSYVFEGLQAIVAGKPAPTGQLAIGAGLAVVYLFLAGWVFARRLSLRDPDRPDRALQRRDRSPSWQAPSGSPWAGCRKRPARAPSRKKICTSAWPPPAACSDARARAARSAGPPASNTRSSSRTSDRTAQPSPAGPTEIKRAMTELLYFLV